MDSENILIVDNSDSLLHQYKRYFEALVPDSQIVTACDGDTALHNLRDQSFELVVVDAHLPDIDSLDLIQEIGRLLPNAHILLMAVHNIQKIEITARRRRLRIDACLDKIPFLMQLWECEGRQLDHQPEP